MVTWQGIVPTQNTWFYLIGNVIVATWRFMLQVLWLYHFRTLLSVQSWKKQKWHLAQKAALLTLSLWVPPFGRLMWISWDMKQPLQISLTFNGGVDSTFQKPPYLCFLQAEIWKAAKNLAKDLFCIWKSAEWLQAPFWLVAGFLGLWGTVRFHPLCFWGECLWGPCSDSSQCVSERRWGRPDFCLKSIMYQILVKIITREGINSETLQWQNTSSIFIFIFESTDRKLCQIAMKALHAFSVSVLTSWQTGLQTVCRMGQMLGPGSQLE